MSFVVNGSLTVFKDEWMQGYYYLEISFIFWRKQLRHVGGQNHDPQSDWGNPFQS